jgi:hypothetical protein
MPSRVIRRPAGVSSRRHASRATSTAYLGVSIRLRAQNRTTASGPAARGGSAGSGNCGFSATCGPTGQDDK